VFNCPVCYDDYPLDATVATILLILRP
jgi:hypothetical protein